MKRSVERIVATRWPSFRPHADSGHGGIAGTTKRDGTFKSPYAALYI